MCLQASPAASQHLPFGNSLSLHFELGVRLEATHHCEADPVGDPEVAEGRAQHLEPSPAVALDSLQEQPGSVHPEGEGLRLELQEERNVIFEGIAIDFGGMGIEVDLIFNI
jgi:hypothetical protein